MAKAKLKDVMAKYDYIYYSTDDKNDFWARSAIKRIGVPKELHNSSKNFDVFRLLHEIGHCETYKYGQYKVMREFLATQWAIEHCKEWGIKVNEEDKNLWQEYIYSFSKAKDKSKYQLDWSKML